MNDGRKDDVGKPDPGLMPPLAEAEVVNVLTHGAHKYGAENWRMVSDAEKRYLSAALRHLGAYRRGEQVDGESGCEHLAHAITSLLFVLELDLLEAERADDVPQSPVLILSSSDR